MRTGLSRACKTKLLLVLTVITVGICAFTIAFQAFDVYGLALLSSVSVREGKAERFNKMNGKTPHGGIVFFGDSLTEMYDLQRYYDADGLVNRGISGDTTDHMAARLYDNALALEPKTLVMLGGANDLRGGSDPERIIAYLRNMFDTIRQCAPDTRVIVQSLYPINAQPEIFMAKKLLAFADNDKIVRVNALLRPLCDEYGFDYVDMHAMLRDSDGNLRREFTLDGLHLNPDGYRVVTRKLMPYVLPE